MGPVLRPIWCNLVVLSYKEKCLQKNYKQIKKCHMRLKRKEERKEDAKGLVEYVLYRMGSVLLDLGAAVICK